MARNKRFIHFRMKADFENELANNNILDTSVCFIAETKEIYTHGQIYDCSGFDDGKYLELKDKIDAVNEKVNNIDVGEGITVQGLLEAVYPVGSVYVSFSPVNPNVLFGFGTWEQIKDTFLLAAGDYHNVEETGGEESHTLTLDEIPAHSHQFNRHQLWRNETGELNSEHDGGYGASNKTLDIYTDNTTSSGGGMAHNNMPPYVSVYMFRRLQ